MNNETYTDRSSANHNQRALAQSLLACMSRDQAIRVCQMNVWDGVLSVLTETEVRT